MWQKSRITKIFNILDEVEQIHDLSGGKYYLPKRKAVSNNNIDLQDTANHDNYFATMEFRPLFN